MFQAFILSIILSLDSLGIGFLYGVRKIKISTVSLFVLTATSLSLTLLASCLGFAIPYIFSESISTLIGCIILIFLGLSILINGLKPNIKTFSLNKSLKLNKIKPLSLIFNILKQPNISDINSSNTIEPIESLFLAIALSIDSVCVSVSNTSLGGNPLIFSFLLCSMQLILLLSGIFLSKKIKLPPKSESVSAIFSGLALIIIAILKLLFN